MDFGIVPYETLSKESFIFQPSVHSVLPGKRATSPKLYIGLTQWSRPEWIGTFYPKGTKNTEELPLYSEHFNAIELNATHYRIPTPEQVKLWHDRVRSDDFHFCPKFSKLITHQGPLKVETKSNLTDSFIASIAEFGNKLGPSFIQLSDYVNISQKETILSYLGSLPKDFKLFIETRHESWYADQQTISAFANDLQHLGMGWVITDTPGRRDVLHMQLPLPHAFIRFVCEDANEIDLFRVQQWKMKLTEWFSNGLETCHFFLHIRNKKKTVEFATYIQTILNDVTKP